MFTRLSAPMLAVASATRNLSPWRLPRVLGPALAADNSLQPPWLSCANSWESPRWDFRACPPPMLPKRRRAAAPANWSSIFFAATSPPRKSLPRRPLRTPSQALPPRAVPRMRYCTCWPSPTRPGSRFPSTILTALVPASPFLQISNREDDLFQPTSTHQAAPRSCQSVSLQLHPFAPTP